MTLNGFDTLFYTVAFLVPGFVLHSTLAALVPEREVPKESALLRFLTFSCFNYAIWSWLIYMIFQVPFFLEHRIITALAWGLVIFVSPVTLGMLLAHLKHKEVIRRALQRLGFSPIHPIPTAWDYKFSKISEPVWVIVTFKNGDQVAGLFSNNSFASSDPLERDLYIEEVLKLEGDGPWQRKPRSEGMLILKDEIKWIEYWELDKENTNVKEKSSETT